MRSQKCPSTSIYLSQSIRVQWEHAGQQAVRPGFRDANCHDLAQQIVEGAGEVDQLVVRVATVDQRGVSVVLPLHQNILYAAHEPLRALEGMLCCEPFQSLQPDVT